VSKRESADASPRPTGESQTANLARHVQSSFDAERAEIARQVHDELGGLLVAIKMDAKMVERGLGESSELRGRMTQLIETLDTAITAQRQMVERIEPGLLKHVGLFAALRWYVDDQASARGRNLRAALPEHEAPLEPDARVLLYRALQEALLMGQPTPGAPTVVSALLDGQTLVMQVTYGAPGSLGAAADVGLQSVELRVHAAGGQLSTDRDNGSSRLVIRLPLRN
jgi:two-component system, NarL family, sensor histidine kinase UhpB